jgi:hypothetical protein
MTSVMALTCGARSRAVHVVVVALAFTSAVASAPTAGTAGGGGGPQWIHGEMFPGVPDGITICGEFWPL